MVQPTVYYGIKNEAVSLTCTVESDKTLVINWFKGKKLHLDAIETKHSCYSVIKRKEQSKP